MQVSKWAALVALASAACVESNQVACGDGRFCPAGTQCAAVTDPGASLCVPESQTEVCADAPRYQPCSTGATPTGRCYDGVCLAVACGNGRVDMADPNTPGDTGETCDDSNQESGDGCSADCTSTETCGNAVVDVAAGEACDDGNFTDNDGCDSTCQVERVGWVGVTEAEPYAGIRNGYDPRYEGYRKDFAMAYDVARNHTVLFGGTGVTGGGRAATGLNDTWVFDGNGWLEIKTDVAPIARNGHTMAYDAKRKRIVLFGGFSEATGTALSDTWEWDGTRWSAVVTPVAPAPRGYHACVRRKAWRRGALWRRQEHARFGGVQQRESVL